MKTVVVHGNAKTVEKDWANQFAGLDADVRREFDKAVDFNARTSKVFVIPAALTWDGIVNTITAAANAAGSGGVVILASGHGGAGSQTRQGIIVWDAADGDVNRGWDAKIVGKGFFWDEDITEYTDVIPSGNPPTRQAEDVANLKAGKGNAKVLKLRQEAFDAYDRIATAFRAAKIARFTLTVCTAGSATVFIDRLAKKFGCEVACFNQKTVVLDDGTFGRRPGKARLVLDSDKSKDGQGTNVQSARVFSPDLDNTRLAHVGKP